MSFVETDEIGDSIISSKQFTYKSVLGWAIANFVGLEARWRRKDDDIGWVELRMAVHQGMLRKWSIVFVR
jgi:hypothetical protein